MKMLALISLISLYKIIEIGPACKNWRTCVMLYVAGRVLFHKNISKVSWHEYNFWATKPGVYDIFIYGFYRYCRIWEISIDAHV